MILYRYMCLPENRRFAFRMADGAYGIAKRKYRTSGRLLFTVVLFLALGNLLSLGLIAWAQRATTQRDTKDTVEQKSGATKTAGNNGVHEVRTLDSLKISVLGPMQDQEVRVEGIIGDFHTANRYEFHMNDGSHAEVIGTYPSAPHTTYVLNARVVHEGTKYVLSEIHKERLEAGGERVKVDPWLLAGGLLLTAAGITFLIMLARNKAVAQKQRFEHHIEQERRTSDIARQKVERFRAVSSRVSTTSGPGGTLVTSGAATAGTAPNESKGIPARTIVSIGSIEVVAGPHLGQKFILQQGETRLGRAAKDGIALERDGEVSILHGRLIVTIDGHILYSDESTNGSRLDGSIVHHRQAEAHSGSELEIGASTLRIMMRTPPSSRLSDTETARVSSNGHAGDLRSVPPPYEMPVLSPSPTPQGSRTAATISLAMPVTRPKTPAAPTQASLGAELEVISGPDVGQRFPITRSVTGLGREEQDILLNEESISRSHATLVYRDNKFLLTDLSSTYGTKVNGDCIGSEARELVDGDQIAPGTGLTVLVFHTVHS